ncbi:Zinc finger protein [Phytophthora cinnamomi]|uniref:Zinc finger protein n=1 Tax=Phytophthora cinnamomi TaxID=4785 RepID=UPI0035599202|nr:Zinc finger protein [Phytophthora cinnamomi]
MMHVESVTKYSYSSDAGATSPSSTASTPPPVPLPVDKPHKCPQRGCGRQFNRKYTLVEHMKTHTGEKPHVCPVRSCSKRFSTSGNLSRHKRLHGVIKPLECPVEGCYCTFPSDNKLDKHMQFHLGSPVHVCTIGNCGKTFSTTGNLNRHVKHHHPNETLRPLPPPQPNAPLLIHPQPLQLQVQVPQVQYPVDMGYQFPSPRVVNPPMKRVMDVVPPSFAPGVAQQYYGNSSSRWSGDYTRPSLAQVMPSQLPSPVGVTPRGTRNPGIADVLSSIFDEMEYGAADPEKPLPAPPLQPQPQNLLDDMVSFHVAHIEL